MNMIFYEIALHFYGLILSIRTIYRSKKLSTLHHLWRPKLPLFSKKVIWVHAVSLGEVKAMKGIIEKLPDYQIIVSTITETGQAEAKKLFPQAFCLFLPLDISYIIKPLVKKASPQLLILSETDFWPNFLKSIPGKVCLVNGKISSRSFKRWTAFPFFSNWIKTNLDHLCLQDQIYQDRFLSLGFDPNKITVTGNIKIDQLPLPLSLEKKQERKKELGCENAFVLTLGSTHSPEEQLFLHSFTPPEKFRCFIVPRHPQRFAYVESLLKKAQVSYSKFSEKKFNTPWILVDQMGILTQLYQISDLAFVGGTLTKKVGGHNLLEPLSCETPTIHGPYLHSQPTLDTLLKKFQASYILEPKKIEQQLKEILNSSSLQEKIRNNGKKLILSSQGALEKNWQVISSLLQ